MKDDSGESLIGRVGPAKLIRRLLSARFLRHEKPRWVRNVVMFQVPDGRVLVFDPICYDGMSPEPHHALDVTLEGPRGQAAVHLQFTGPRVSVAHTLGTRSGTPVTSSDSPAS